MEIEKEIVERYKTGINLRTLSKECKIPEKKLSKFLSEKGILRSRGAVKKYSYNDSVFDNYQRKLCLLVRIFDGRW